MNTYHCCEQADSDSCSEPVTAENMGVGSNAPTFKPRHLEMAGWVLPGAILALLPKCPACLAAYVAVWTGLGLSFSTAAHLRIALVTLCTTALLYLAVRRLRLFVAKGRPYERE